MHLSAWYQAQTDGGLLQHAPEKLFIFIRKHLLVKARMSAAWMEDKTLHSAQIKDINLLFPVGFDKKTTAE